MGSKLPHDLCVFVQVYLVWDEISFKYRNVCEGCTPVVYGAGSKYLYTVTTIAISKTDTIRSTTALYKLNTICSCDCGLRKLYYAQLVEASEARTDAITAARSCWANG